MKSYVVTMISFVDTMMSWVWYHRLWHMISYDMICIWHRILNHIYHIMRSAQWYHFSNKWYQTNMISNMISKYDAIGSKLSYQISMIWSMMQSLRTPRPASKLLFRAIVRKATVCYLEAVEFSASVASRPSAKHSIIMSIEYAFQSGHRTRYLAAASLFRVGSKANILTAACCGTLFQHRNWETRGTLIPVQRSHL